MMTKEMVVLKKKYLEEIVPEMQKRFNYTNKMRIPKLEKICINRSMSASKSTNKTLDSMVKELTIISGQKPLVTKSKKSISNFKLRENLEIGCKVTMRGERMYNFLYVFINLVLPKIRDFRGIPVNSFDGQGNYSMGLKDQIIFPGINFDQVESLRGMDVTFVTSAKNNEECRALLEYFGMPFRKN